MSLDERADEIERLCAAGRSQREIARACGIPRTSLQKLMRRHGIATASRPVSGPASHHWKGDSVGYRAFHNRVQARRGTPARCERCGTADPAKKYEWANLTGNYADLDDYERMCVSCHRRFDARHRKAAEAAA